MTQKIPIKRIDDTNTTPTSMTKSPGASIQTTNIKSENTSTLPENEQYLRLLAEFNNYRRRTEKEKAVLRENTRAETYQKILPVMDDFDRLLENMNADTDGLIDGIRLIHAKLKKILTDEGLEQINPQGEQFDPNQHEAFLTVPTNDPALDHTIVEVLETGYQYQGKLLRPAKVTVAKY